VLLAWSWQGADTRPLALVRDAGNMGTYAAGFFPPDFSEWRTYLKEMVITLHIAIWGTALAIVCAIPCGLLCSSNIAPWRIHQPMRRGALSCGPTGAMRRACAPGTTAPRPRACPRRILRITPGS
jgi:phosphonate transport system permease protein